MEKENILITYSFSFENSVFQNLYIVVMIQDSVGRVNCCQFFLRYIVLMANETSRSTDFDSLATKGTGGSGMPNISNIHKWNSSVQRCIETESWDFHVEDANIDHIKH